MQMCADHACPALLLQQETADVFLMRSINTGCGDIIKLLVYTRL